MAKSRSEAGPTYPEGAPPLEKFKIPPEVIPSDDLIVHVGRVIEDGEVTQEGTPYAIHAGEAVWMLRANTMRLWLKWGALVTHRTDTESMADAFALLEQHYDSVCEELSRRIVAWTWTDLDGEPLAQPYRQPSVLRELDADEILYLTKAVMREAPGENKAASAN